MPQVYEAESAGDPGGVCLVRRIGGVARVGQAYVPAGTAEGLPADLRSTLTRIGRYGRSAGLLAPLTPPGSPSRAEGWRRWAADRSFPVRPDPHRDGERTTALPAPWCAGGVSPASSR
ncbi:hypothetical protein SATRM34S_05626 [Streptomyces atroolivaceus]